jgi:hypothetical protein
MSSRGQTTRGGPAAWGLGVGLTTLYRKKLICYEILLKAIINQHFREVSF